MSLDTDRNGSFPDELRERTAVLESKVDGILSKVDDLHADLIARKARWHFFKEASRYGLWVLAGVASLFGLKISNWLGMAPQ